MDGYRDDRKRDMPQTSKNTGEILRIVAGILGILIIIIGLIYSVMLFHQIYDVLKDPKVLEPALKEWAKAVGGSKLDLKAPGLLFPLAPAIGIFLFGCGALVSCHACNVV